MNFLTEGPKFISQTLHKFIPEIQSRELRKEIKQLPVYGDSAWKFTPLISLSVSAALEHYIGKFDKSSDTALNVFNEVGGGYWQRIGGLVISTSLIFPDIWNKIEDYPLVVNAFIEYANPGFGQKN